MGKVTAALVIVALLVIVASPVSAGVVVSIRYVKADATGADNGTSWADAYLLLESALAAASPGDEIWVATGTYKPTYDYGLGLGDRGKHFRMKNGVGIYGGFAGTETLRSQRNWTTNVTTLSGDIGIGGDSSDNCYHVFHNPEGLNLDNTAVVDGFTVTGGNADGAEPHNYGGGMGNEYSSPTVTNCAFSGNSAESCGGGMENFYHSSPTVTNCAFSGNSAESCGGGMDNDYHSSPTVTNCTFSGNSAESCGGGMYNCGESYPTVTNCTFSGNSADCGGGMYNCVDSSSTVTNCTLWGDSAPEGAEVYNEDGFYEPVFSYCDIAGSGGSGAWIGASIGTDGGGNIDANPRFANAGVGNLHLQAGSPCIDAADGSAAPATDKDGYGRHDDPGMPNVGVGPPWADMGAYEFQGDMPETTTTTSATTTSTSTTTTLLSATTTSTTTTTLPPTTTSTTTSSTTSTASTTTTTSSTTTTLPAGATVWAAGNNDHGQLGLGDTTDRHNFTQAGGGLAGKTVTAIAGGWVHSLALAGDGTLWAAGYNSDGELGLGDTADRHSFIQVGGNLFERPIITIAAGQIHSLALAGDGTLWAAGYNYYGQLGLGDTTDRHVFVQVGGELAAKTITAISGGGAHSLALAGDGTLWATGGNFSGQLGFGDTADRYSFTQVGGDLASKNIIAIAAGYQHSLALADDGTLWATGNNSFGQLGLGDTTERHSFTQVGGDLTGKTITLIVAAEFHSLVLAGDGTLWATGSNGVGQLGLDDIANHSSFAQVGGDLAGKTITAIAGGRDHSLVLAGDGTLWAAGGNGVGQIGLGDTSECHSFTNVSDPSPVLGIGAGAFHSLILAEAVPVTTTTTNSTSTTTTTTTTTTTSSTTTTPTIPPSRITVVYPSDPGITVERGKTCLVQWTSAGLPVKAKLKVELVKGSGGTWTLSAGASKVPLKWSVGKAIKGAEMYPDGSDYKIRVSMLDGSTLDRSDNDFAIGTVESLTIIGATSVTGGSTAQYACTAHYNFGADRDVTTEVKWSCTKIKGVKMGKTGLLATAPAVADQPCSITAAYGKGKPPITGTLDITITP